MERSCKLARRVPRPSTVYKMCALKRLHVAAGPCALVASLVALPHVSSDTGTHVTHTRPHHTSQLPPNYNCVFTSTRTHLSVGDTPGR